jgi:hypothetical protein
MSPVEMKIHEFWCVNCFTENEKEYGRGRLKYQEQKNEAWIGGAMDIQEEEGNIVVSSDTAT